MGLADVELTIGAEDLKQIGDVSIVEIKSVKTKNGMRLMARVFDATNKRGWVLWLNEQDARKIARFAYDKKVSEVGLKLKLGARAWSSTDKETQEEKHGVSAEILEVSA